MAPTSSTEALENANALDLLGDRPAKTAFKSSENDSGVTEKSLFTDEKVTTSGSGSFISSDNEPQEPLEIALMVQITKEKCRLTLIQENGTLHPFSPGNNELSSTGSYNIPFKLGIVRHKVLVYGETVVQYENAREENTTLWEKTFVSFNLGEHLLDNNSSSMKFMFDDKLVNAKIELLVGLFIKNLKDMVKHSLDSSTTFSHEVKKIIILVPIWYTNLHRQRIKDSAQIAGFNENYIVNETSALALIHVASKRLSPGTPLNMLVLSENSGNTDLSFYSCESGNFVKLVAVTGNRYDFRNNMNPGYYYAGVLKKLKCNKMVKEVNDSEKNLMMKRNFLRCLLEEIRQQLPRDEDPVQFVDCVVLSLSSETDWAVAMKHELHRNAINQYEHIGAHPVGIQSGHWQPPRILVKDFVGAKTRKIHDIMPINLHQTLNISTSKGKILKVEGKVSYSSNVITAYPMENSTFYEKDLLGDQWEVGTIKVKPLFFFSHNYPIVEMKLRQRWEGLFKLETVFARDSSGNHERILNSEIGDYFWSPCNLKAKEKHEFTLVITDMLECSERYLVERSKTVEELWNISTELADKMFDGKHSRRLRNATKSDLDEKVKRTLGILKKISMSQIIEVSTGDLRKILKEFRHDHKKYF